MRFAAAAALLVLAGCVGPTTTTEPGMPSALPAPDSPGRSIEDGPGRSGEDGAAFVLAEGCPNDCFEPSIATDILGRTVIAPSSGQPSVGTSDGDSFYPLPGVPLPEGSPETAESEDGWLVAAPDEPRIYWITFLAQAPPAIHVASSPDGGQTWDRNVALNPVQGQRNVVLVDRPWLGVAPGGVLYVTYNNEGGLWIARSQDGGQTFGAFGPVTQALANLGGAGAGPPVIDGAGRIFVPYFGNPTGPLTPPPVPGEKSMVARSEDGGLTFTHHEVGPPGAFFPVLARGADGRLSMAWTADGGDVLVASSSDHGQSWGQPQPWSGELPAVVGPWLLAGPDGLHVTWFHRVAAHEYELVLASGRDGPARTDIVITGLANLPHPNRGDLPGTDYSSAAFLADGRVGMVWGRTEGALLGIGIR